MRSLIIVLGLCLAEAFPTSFQITAQAASGRRRQTATRTTTTSTLFSSYLSSLSSAAPAPSYSPAFSPSPPVSDISSYLISPKGNNGGSNSNNKKFQHATLDYFAIPNLVPKGPRANADVGQPHDASLKLGQDGDLRSGSWFCAAGGWPSLKQRTTTEIFYVIKGQGCLTDLDGMRHYFGPGDTVILPKGWSGRWDVLEDIHKVWFVHDHPNIEVTAQPIRVQIANYHTFAPQYMVSSGIRADAIHGSPSTASKVLYDVGPTEVGIWTCTPGSFPVINRQNTECCHVLEGVFFLTNAEDNTSRRCGPGDTVILPKGWSGYWDVIEPVKKLWCVV